LIYSKKIKMKIFFALFALFSIAYCAEYTGTALGGYNLFTYYGNPAVTSCPTGQETVAGGVSSGTDLTFLTCNKASDFGLNGDISTSDDDAYFVATYDGTTQNVTVTLFTDSACSSPPIWAVIGVVGGCECNAAIFGGCLSITVPLWTANIFNAPASSCAASGTVVSNLLENRCYDGSQYGIGFYMLWTFQCQYGNVYPASCSRYEAYTTVRHELVYQCEAGCNSNNCANTWTVNPTDCKCDGSSTGGCVLADFTAPASSVVASVTVLAAFVLALLY